MQPTALLTLSLSACSWERASTEVYAAALTHLSSTTDIYEQTRAATRMVDEVLSEIKRVGQLKRISDSALTHGQCNTPSSMQQVAVP